MAAPRGRGEWDRIELLDADADVDAVRWSADPVPATSVPRPAGRRRGWIGLGAAGVLAAVVVVANVLGGPNDHPRAIPPATTARATSTTAVATTAAPTTSSEGDREITGGTFVDSSPPVVADAPDGFVVTYAERYSGGFTGPPGRLLFAGDPADPATSGWVLVTVTPSPTRAVDPVSVAGRQRVPVAGGVAIVDRDAGGTLTMTAPVVGGELAMQASGVEAATLAAIAGEATITDDRLTATTPFTSRGLQLLADDEGGAHPATIATTIGFSSPDDRTAWLYVSAGAPLSTFDRATRAFMLRDARVVVLDGVRTAIVGSDARFAELRQAIVDVDGTEVTIVGQTDEAVLAVAASLRTASDDEWQALRTSADAGAAASSTATVQPWTSTFLRSGTMTGALPWRLELQSGEPPYLTVDTSGATKGSVTATYSTGVSLDATLAAGAPGIQPVATSRGMILVAVAGRAQAGARLVVTAGEATLADDLSDPGATAPGLFGAVAYSELVAYHAELVAADGSVLATLDGM